MRLRLPGVVARNHDTNRYALSSKQLNSINGETYQKKFLVKSTGRKEKNAVISIQLIVRNLHNKVKLRPGALFEQFTEKYCYAAPQVLYSDYGYVEEYASAVYKVHKMVYIFDCGQLLNNINQRRTNHERDNNANERNVARSSLASANGGYSVALTITLC